jgi:hypothetical protein
VKRGDRRDPECTNEVNDAGAVLAAPDPVLVLDRDDVDAPAQGVGSARVVVRLVPADSMVDFDRIGRRRLLGRMKRDDLAVAGVGREVAGERGNSAVSWWIRRDEGSANDGVLLLGVVRGVLRRTVAGRRRWSTTVRSETGADC